MVMMPFKMTTRRQMQGQISVISTENDVLFLKVLSCKITGTLYDGTTQFT